MSRAKTFTTNKNPQTSYEIISTPQNILSLKVLFAFSFTLHSKTHSSSDFPSSSFGSLHHLNPTRSLPINSFDLPSSNILNNPKVYCAYNDYYLSCLEVGNKDVQNQVKNYSDDFRK